MGRETNTATRQTRIWKQPRMLRSEGDLDSLHLVGGARAARRTAAAAAVVQRIKPRRKATNHCRYLRRLVLHATHQQVQDERLWPVDWASCIWESRWRVMAGVTTCCRCRRGSSRRYRICLTKRRLWRIVTIKSLSRFQKSP